MVHAWHGLPQCDGLLKRADLLINLLLQTYDPLFEPIPFLQQFGQQEAVMRSDPSFQRLYKLRNLVLYFPRANCASCSGLSWPSMIASSMWRPDTPSVFVATELSLRFACSRSFWIRLATRLWLWRSSTR